ncbi:MAG: hypothetical protein DLM65_11850, partial [Candidatus Aeolococcus gillhamiae]
MLGQFGLDPSAVVAPRAAVDGTGSDRSFDVFHVADAVGSPLIPDQDDFVVPYAIRSVIGFGGVLPSGSAFAVVLFTTVAVPRESASMFAPLALSVKVGILPFDDGRVFDDEPCAEVATTERSLRSQVAALTQLIEVRERLVGAQTAQLEAAFATLEERSAQLSDALSALAISEARHEALMEASIDAVITMDHEGRVLGFNPAASRIFGYEQEAALGQPLDDLVIPPRLRPNHREGLRNYLRDGVGPILGRHIEQTGMRADGSEFPVELTVTAMEVPGAPPAFAATVRDISVEKETRGRLKEAREHSARVARTLQESLLPPRLPALPGVELASRYHPAGDGSEIGGDF